MVTSETFDFCSTSLGEVFPDGAYTWNLFSRSNEFTSIMFGNNGTDVFTGNTFVFSQNSKK